MGAKSAKPIIMPRKPGQSRSPVDAAAAQKFLDGGSVEGSAVEHLNAEPSAQKPLAPKTTSQPQKALGGQPSRERIGSGKRTLTRSRNGESVRQTTVYLPVQLSRQLAFYCADVEADKSSVIVRALDQFLQQQDAKANAS